MNNPEWKSAARTTNQKRLEQYRGVFYFYFSESLLCYIEAKVQVSSLTGDPTSRCSL